MSDNDSGRESPFEEYRPRAHYHHPKLVDDDCNTPLHYAAAQNNEEKIRRLVEKEKHVVDCENYLGWTPLMMAARLGHIETVKLLISYGANASRMNKFGMNVFQISLASESLQLVAFLLDHLLTGGVSIRYLERSFSAVSLAVLFRRQDILKFLIEKRFNINERTNETGVTPFMIAHAMENDGAISTLLKNKVDTKAKNVIGHTAVDIATIRHHMKSAMSQEHKILSQKLSSTLRPSPSNEFQTQQLRNALQVNQPSPQQLAVCTPKPPIPYILFTPHSSSPHQFFQIPGGDILPQSRRSSNVSPFPVPPPPNVTPIPQSVFGHVPQQVFFPADFSPSNPHFAPVTGFNTSEVLNTRINVSPGYLVDSPMMHFLSPYL